MAEKTGHEPDNHEAACNRTKIDLGLAAQKIGWLWLETEVKDLPNGETHFIVKVAP